MDLNAKLFFQAVAVMGTFFSLGFFGLSAAGISSFVRHRKRKNELPVVSVQPPVTILKPLKGVDPGMWESFRSHCQQDYPAYQLVFGVSDAQDPAAELVWRLQKEYPTHDIQLVIADRILGTNTKVSTLAQMLPAARYDLFVVNDSDIAVSRDYLKRLTNALAAPEVGLVTCLYRGTASKTIGSRLESLSISTDFAIGVMSARLVERGLHFGLGSTLAFRRSDLEAIGNFEALADYLADDYELGHRIAGMGKRVELSEAVVETSVPPYSMAQFFEHQLRWSRTIRDSRRWGYVGLIFTFGVPWALLTLLVTGGVRWAWILAFSVVAGRCGLAFFSAVTVLRDRQFLRDWFLLPIRDLIAPVIWLLSFAGNRISWRGDLFYLKDGRLARVTGSASSH